LFAFLLGLKKKQGRGAASVVLVDRRVSDAACFVDHKAAGLMPRGMRRQARVKPRRRAAKATRRGRGTHGHKHRVCYCGMNKAEQEGKAYGGDGELSFHGQGSCRNARARPSLQTTAAKSSPPCGVKFAAVPRKIGLRFGKRRRRRQDTPASSAKQVFAGFFWAFPGRFFLVASADRRRKKLFRRWYARATRGERRGNQGKERGQWGSKKVPST